MTVLDNKPDPSRTRQPHSAPANPPAQRPNTPVPAELTAIPPARFYGTSALSSPPPLPSRPHGVGSNLMMWQPIAERDPPSYSYREPELIEDTTSAADDDHIPALLETDTTGAWQAGSEWDYTSTPDWNALSVWNDSPKANVPITDRNDHEESRWYHGASYHRPGRGLLPPKAEAALHDQDHTLFSVTAVMPTNDPPQLAPAAQPTRNHSLPTLDQVRMAIPHPNAYYCPKDNAWVLLSWKSSSIPPPLRDKNITIPRNYSRTTNALCSEDTFKHSRTHHFHPYHAAIDSSQLTPPYYGFEAEEAIKRKAEDSEVVVVGDEADGVHMVVDIDDDPEETGFMLDLYICCQCPLYCVSSHPIPGVIPFSVWSSYIQDRKTNPRMNESGDQSVVNSVAKILSIVEYLLFHSMNRNLKVGKSLISSIGYNDTVTKLFNSLGFTLSGENDSMQLHPPILENMPGPTRIARAKLLRAWIEMNAWLVDYKRRTGVSITSGFTTSVSLINAREMIQTGIGSHPSQIPRDVGSHAADLMAPEFWTVLGLTKTTATAEMIEFAYLAQCRCDPAATPVYFSALCEYVKELSPFEACPQQLVELMSREESRGRFRTEDVQSSARVLGFGEDAALRIPYDEQVGDDFIEQAWKHLVKESWKTGSGQKEADTALKILAQARGSQHLLNLFENAEKNMMNPERAYQALECPVDVDDTMLLAIYAMRVEEQPLQLEKWRAVLQTLAEVRNSERLREYAQSGMDPGDTASIIRADWPRGLNQLGNTCYLNSLLQYFYTIKDLRDAVGQGVKAVDEDEKLSDNDLKRHRVGGRLVTRREILRSKKFVNQLAQLFTSLEHEVNSAVTPTIELAKLALVTSKDEEEDEIEQGGTDSSNDTDATLVDDGPVRIPVAEMVVASPPKSPSPARSPGSVLGKRHRDVLRSAMDVDAPSSSLTTMNESQIIIDDSPPPLIPVDLPEASGSGSRHNYDVEMKNPPPLPPRKSSQFLSDSDMMFGKQHDVAECMDNCMFQIETALLKFDDVSGSQSETDKTSIVKRLFYGKIRQNVLAQNENLEKEDLFSHLPVNVGEEGFDIYDGLGQYFYDLVDYKDQKVPMQLSIVNLPPILHIQLQRVKFDRESCQSWKSQAYVKFWETIYIDRFMDDADPVKKEQARVLEDQLNAARERLATLQRGKNTPYESVIDRTRGFLSREDVSFTDVDDAFLADLDSEKSLLHLEIVDLQMQITTLKNDLESIWKDEQKVPYELTSVFIHRGSTPTFGHYFFYSRNLPGNPDEWFKYNDSEVSTITKAEVLADTTGSTANPYLLVFARKDSNVVDTVKRFDVDSFLC